MRRTTIGFCLAAAVAGYAAGQWQLADYSRSAAQDAAAPPTAAAAPAVEQPAESDMERKYVEKSRQLFRTLSPEQQQQALGTLDQQLRQAEALAAIKKVEKELREIAEKYSGTFGGSLAIEAERVLQQHQTGTAAPVFRPDGFNAPMSRIPANPSPAFNDALTPPTFIQKRSSPSPLPGAFEPPTPREKPADKS